MKPNPHVHHHPRQRALLRLRLAVLLATALLLAGAAQAEVPSTISFQGRLTTPAGVPVADGTYSVTFRLYDDATGGNLFWEELQSVSTKGGLFSVQLGQTYPLDQSTLSIPNLFLAIQIGAGAELTPRSKLNVVPYATLVGTVEGANGGGIIGDVYATGQVSGSSSTGSGGYFQSFKTTPGNQRGLVGKFSAPGDDDGSGVYGYSRPGDGLGIGGEFEGGWTGVQGTARAATDSHYLYRGVYGEAYSDVPERAANLRGVVGSAAGALENYGVAGYASGSAFNSNCSYYGIYAVASGMGINSNNYGVYCSAEGGAGNFGIIARGSTIAGYFIGDVDVFGTLSKSGGSFKIDHPLDPANKYLQHSFVESPDMMNIYNGITNLDAGGKATITMPEWFDALNRDFRYQLTAIGAPGPNLYVAEEVNDNRFSIAGGSAGMRVSWQVTGVRQDVWAEAHRIQIEVPKAADKIGTYMFPELFGKPESLGETYEMTKHAGETARQSEQDRERMAARKIADNPKK